ncbi:putative motility protein [Brevibacillus panacihumi]|uniref:putative motility protein n=1 Tax=Brevibacillus panacihumi TaxID=497735 RepID=UPI003D20CDE8
MNAIQLQQTVTFSVTKQVQETMQAQAAILLEGFAQTQQNIQAAQAPHPLIGKVLDVRV